MPPIAAKAKTSRPLRRKTAHSPKKNAVFSVIVERLISSVYNPGERISEFALSKELGVSRGPIREVLNQLADSGWVDLVPGFGAYVKLPDRREMLELYQNREAIECLAAELAAHRITEEQLSRIREGCDLIQREAARLQAAGLDDYDELASIRTLEGDVMVHNTILEASGNRWLIRTLGQLHIMIRGWSQKPDFKRYPLQKMMKAVDKEHRAILAALEARDARKAARAMHYHLRRTARCFIRQYAPENPNLQYPQAVIRKMLGLELALNDSKVKSTS